MPRQLSLKMMARRISFCLLLFAGIGIAQVREFPIDSIAVEGNRILTADGIAAASGLKLGQPGDTTTFDAARDRLLATAYFETVAYRFKASEKGSGYDVTFEIQEMQPLYPIAVEALPVTAAEINAWLKTKDPLFTGRIPGTQQVLDRTSHEIEELLASKNLAGQVAGKIVSVSPQRFEARFTPAAGLPNVALVTFEGNKAVRDTDLQNAIADVAFGQPYTESSFRVLLDNQIKALYEKSGYVRAAFGKLTTTPSTQVKGVDVHVVITEGPQYKLGKVGVRGPMEDQSKHILRVAKVPTMAILNFDEIRNADVRVKEALRQEGYLDVEVSTEREIDDEKKIVDVYLLPQPGPQYTFGKLEVKGLGLDAEAAIKGIWTVKTGDPYPGDYPDYFVKRVKEEGYFDNLGDARAEPRVNADTHVVDVTLTFVYTPGNRSKKPGTPGQDPNQPQQPFPPY
jgi:outer membrane protein insertion porin family